MNARFYAVSALIKTEANGYSNLVLKQLLPQTVSSQDASFCSAVFYGTLSRVYTLDFIFQTYIAKPVAKLDAEVRAILRAGLYQIRYMDGVRVESAVDESVKLARQFKKSSAAGLVNAVLRKASGWSGDFRGNLSAEYSLSPSIVETVKAQYPESYKDIFSAWLLPPVYCVRANSLKTSAAELKRKMLAQGVVAEDCPLEGALNIANLGDAFRTDLFKDGFARVQGIWSQYAAHALEAKEGETVFDMCAAPGGKSLTVAQLMNNRGTVRAFDVNSSRLKGLPIAAEREGIDIISVSSNDACVYDPSLGLADRVLCDVPCSNLGVIASKPEVRTRDMMQDAELPDLQLSILSCSAKYVRRGGRLVYSTCTINQAENDGVAERFLSEHPDFCAVMPESCKGLAKKGEKFIKILPFDDNMFGFYIASFERI